MSKILDFLGGTFYNKQVLTCALETFCHSKFTRDKMNEDNLNERDDYGVLSSKQQYTHGSLFKYKSFDQSDLPESPQILDIYSVVVLWLLFTHLAFEDPSSQN